MITFYLLIFLFHTCTSSQELNSAVALEVNNKQNIVFHPKGLYATSATYQHVRIKFNVSSIMSGLYEAEESLKVNAKQKQFWLAGQKGVYQFIAQTGIDTIEELRKDILNQMASVPKKSKQKRSITEAINTGKFVLQSLFGIGTDEQTEKLANEANEAKKIQNKIIDLQEVHKEHLTILHKQTNELHTALSFLYNEHPSVFQSTVQEVVKHAKDTHSTFTHSLKQAMVNKISPTLFTAELLQNTFKHLAQLADDDEYNLLISRPRDLYRVPVSYLISADNQLMIMLHVPIVRKGSLLTMYQYKPFPLTQTFANNTSLTPTLGSKDIIAVLHRDGKSHYKVLGHSDLVACWQLEGTYVCDGRNILRTNLADTCIGSLYGQHKDGIMKHCKFELRERKEIVYSIGPGEYLAYTKQQFQTHVMCGKKASDLHVPTLAKIKIAGGCQVKLQQTMLLPEEDRYFETAVVHLHLEWDSLSLFPSMDTTEINNLISGMKSTGAHVLSAKDIQRYRFQSRTSFHSKTNSFMILGLVSLLVVTAIILGCFFRRRGGVCRTTGKPWKREKIVPIHTIVQQQLAPPKYNDIRM